MNDGNQSKIRTKQWHKTAGKWQQVLDLGAGETVGSGEDCGKLEGHMVHLKRQHDAVLGNSFLQEEVAQCYWFLE